MDEPPVHRSGKLKRGVEKHKQQLRLIQLPGYSPDLNPDELLNQDVKSNALGRRRPSNQSEMIGDVRSYLRSTQRQRAIVKKFFEHETVQYAA